MTSRLKKLLTGQINAYVGIGVIGITALLAGGQIALRIEDQVTFCPARNVVAAKVTPKITPSPRAQILQDVNKEREKIGLVKLKYNAKLNKAAQQKLLEIDKRDEWVHNFSDGTEYHKYIKDQGYKWDWVGENLAINFTSQQVVQKWMESPKHKDNLLFSKFRDMGIAEGWVDIGYGQEYVIVQMFGVVDKLAR